MLLRLQGMVRRMKTGRSLRELFSFPGFIAGATLKGVFGDPKQRIVTLQRRKKPPCAPAAATAAPTATTSVCAVSAWRLHVEFERWRVEAQDHRQLPATATRKRQIAPTLILEGPNLGMMCKLITERTR